MSADEQLVTVCPGDTVEFVWTGVHNVATVPTQGGFDQCDKKNSETTSEVSPYSVTVTQADVGAAPGFYICSISDHCKNGQKLKVVTEDCSANATDATDAAAEGDDNDDGSDLNAAGSAPVLALAAASAAAIAFR